MYRNNTLIRIDYPKNPNLASVEEIVYFEADKRLTTTEAYEQAQIAAKQFVASSEIGKEKITFYMFSI